MLTGACGPPEKLSLALVPRSHAENEGSGKDQFLGDPDWFSEMQYNTISPLFADY